MRCVEREKLSPAESSFKGSICEVHPGVGPVKKMKSVIAGSGITHVTCTEGRIRVI